VLEDPAARSAETKAAGLVKGETACNRSACQIPIKGNRWWNTSTRAWYCQHCALRINRETKLTLCLQEGTPECQQAMHA
jgi:hypothetical protein